MPRLVSPFRTAFRSSSSSSSSSWTPFRLPTLSLLLLDDVVKDRRGSEAEENNRFGDWDGLWKEEGAAAEEEEEGDAELLANFNLLRRCVTPLFFIMALKEN